MTTTPTGADTAASMRATVRARLSRHRVTMRDALRSLQDHDETLARMASLLVDTLRAGRTVMVAGNGGSAAEAQHFSAELVGRFLKDREPYAAIALTTDTSILTAIGNDYSYEEVFSRQVQALGRPGDLLIGFSTSGESPNVIRAMEAARARGMKTMAFTGHRECRMQELADLGLGMPTAETPIVQELHTAMTHLLCAIVEDELTRG